MKKTALIICVLAVTLLCGCSVKELTKHTLEVDFSKAVNLQVMYNEHIYDTLVSFDGTTMVLEFINDTEPIGGATVEMTAKEYKISYMDMLFKGETKDLVDSCLPVVIFNSFSSNSVVTFDEYDSLKECFTLSKSVSDYFLEYEAYSTDNKIFLSLEIK